MSSWDRATNTLDIYVAIETNSVTSSIVRSTDIPQSTVNNIAEVIVHETIEQVPLAFEQVLV